MFIICSLERREINSVLMSMAKSTKKNVPAIDDDDSELIPWFIARSMAPSEQAIKSSHSFRSGELFMDKSRLCGVSATVL